MYKLIEKSSENTKLRTVSVCPKCARPMLNPSYSGLNFDCINSACGHSIAPKASVN